MLFRVALAGVVVAVVIVVVGGPWGSGFAWGVAAYLVWRAAPGVRRDFTRASRRVPTGVALPRVRRARGERL